MKIEKGPYKFIINGKMTKDDLNKIVSNWEKKNARFLINCDVNDEVVEKPLKVQESDDIRSQFVNYDSMFNQALKICESVRGFKK